MTVQFNPLVDIALAIRNALGVWAYPPLSALIVMLISIIISLTSNLVNRRFIDYDRLKRSREEINKWQAMKKQAKEETDPRTKRKLELKVKRRERYIMKLQTDVSKQSFIPMLITIVPFMLVFAIMNGVFIMPPGPYAWDFPVQSPVLYSPLNFAQLLGPLGGGFGFQDWQWTWGVGNIYIPPGGMGLIYIYWYIICSFTMNMVIQKFLGTSMTTGMGPGM
jgi:uncharacterized membrane protein (DUF106 family)